MECLFRRKADILPKSALEEALDPFTIKVDSNSIEADGRRPRVKPGRDAIKTLPSTLATASRREQSETFAWQFADLAAFFS